MICEYHTSQITLGLESYTYIVRQGSVVSWHILCLPPTTEEPIRKFKHKVWIMCGGEGGCLESLLHPATHYWYQPVQHLVPHWYLYLSTYLFLMYVSIETIWLNKAQQRPLVASSDLHRLHNYKEISIERITDITRYWV